MAAIQKAVMRPAPIFRRVLWLNSRLLGSNEDEYKSGDEDGDEEEKEEDVAVDFVEVTLVRGSVPSTVCLLLFKFW